MQKDVLIIGQGICGTFLSLELERAGLSYIVIDEERPYTASRAAAGLINPVTGRRIVKTWMIDELLPFAQEAYRQAGEVLGPGSGFADRSGDGPWDDQGDRPGGRPAAGFIQPACLVDFFPTPQMRLAFLDRFAENPQYLQLPKDEHSWDMLFRYELGYGLIGPCWLVDMTSLLRAARNRMAERGVLQTDRFELADLVVAPAKGMASNSPETVDGGPPAVGSVRYRDMQASWVIFCDGIESFTNPFFSRLPFAPNKGEALIVEIPELAAAGMGAGQTIFKKGISLIPWRDGLYWVGSSFEWSFKDSGPTATFRERTEAILREWLKMPVRTQEHLASVRPATLERRPFVGLHPIHPAVGILNGMGTKGCTLAPYFARQLVQRLINGNPIRADADILRFRKVLSRG